MFYSLVFFHYFVLGEPRGSLRVSFLLEKVAVSLGEFLKCFRLFWWFKLKINDISIDLSTEWIILHNFNCIVRSLLIDCWLIILFFRRSFIICLLFDFGLISIIAKSNMNQIIILSDYPTNFNVFIRVISFQVHLNNLVYIALFYLIVHFYLFLS